MKPRHDNNVARKIDLIARAWEEHAPESKLAGMTLAEFKTAVASSLTIRTSIQAKRLQIRSDLVARGVADKAANATAKRVVHAVLADPAFGDNSPFYGALEYVPADERASGLVRPGSVAAAASTIAAPTAPTA